MKIQAMYNPLQQAHYYQQYYGTSAPSSSNPYYYGSAASAGGYQLQASPSPRGVYPTHPGHRMQGSSYLYYPPTQPMEGSFSPYPATPPTLQQPPFTRRSFSSPTGKH